MSGNLTEPGTREILLRAKGLIATPDQWTQQAFARTSYGAAVEVTDPKAQAFDIVGAVRRAVFDLTGDSFQLHNNELARETLAVLYETAGIGHGLSVWNDDDTTHAEVMALFEVALHDDGQ
jgi:hypothetical protein